VLALNVAVLLLPIDYTALGQYGYLGVFLATLLAIAGWVVPVPYVAVIIVAGTFLNPLAVGVVAGVASAIGELTGYLVGQAGRSAVAGHPWYPRVEAGVRRFGALGVFVTAAVPNPVFKIVGVVAGAAHVGVMSFVLACLAGRTLRFWLLAAAGEMILSSTIR
jgi:membrane protein YqaA with SNARE-associated domain